MDQIRSLPKRRLIKKIDELSAQDAMLLRQIFTEIYGE